MTDIKRLGGSVNAVVVQLPERKWPGVVVQSDSMHNILSLVRDAKQKMSANDWDELRDILDELDGILSAYAAALPKI